MKLILMKLLNKDRKSATFFQLNLLYFLLIYFNKKEMPQIQTFNKRMCDPYSQISPIYRGSTHATWGKKCTSNSNVNTGNNLKSVCVRPCVRACVLVCAEALGDARPMNTLHLRILCRYVAKVHALTALHLHSVFTCLLNLLVYAFHPEFSTKEDFTDPI
jgi:hypothetical protein